MTTLVIVVQSAEVVGCPVFQTETGAMGIFSEQLFFSITSHRRRRRRRSCELPKKAAKT